MEIASFEISLRSSTVKPLSLVAGKFVVVVDIAEVLEIKVIDSDPLSSLTLVSSRSQPRPCIRLEKYVGEL